MTLIFCIHYFLWYGALTSIFGYEGVYARHYTNASTMLFGYLKMFLPFATVIVTPIVCSMADRRRTHRLYFTSALVVAQLALSCLALIPIVSDKLIPSKSHDPHQSQDDNGNLLVGPWIMYCLATLAYDLAIGVTSCLGDSFAVLQAEESGISFGRVIVWGTFGWASSALVLSLVNQVSFLPRLLPGVLFGVVMLTVDILVVTFWRFEKDFILDKIPRDAARTITGSSSSSRVDPTDYLPANESARVNLGLEMSTTDGKMRRRIESPVDILLASRQPSPAELSPKRLEHPSTETDLAATIVLTIHSELDNDQQARPQGTKVEAGQKGADKVLKGQKPEQRATSFRIQCLLFYSIIRRRKTLIRYLILFFLSGFFMSMHWNYFFLYLEQIYFERFELISALSMIGQGLLGELPFFVLSSKFIEHLGRSHTLSVSFVTIGLRFLLYRFLLPNVSMFLIFIADCFQGPNYGLFYVVMTEVGLEFSYCDDETIELMVAKGEIERDDQRQVDSLRLSLRSTIQSVAFACYEGLGVGMGSLVGGYVIASYSFNTLWLVMAAASISVGLGNLLVELLCREHDPEDDLSERREFIEARRRGVLKSVASPRPLPKLGQAPLSPIRFQLPLAAKLQQLKAAATKLLAAGQQQQVAAPTGELPARQMAERHK